MRQGIAESCNNVTETIFGVAAGANNRCNYQVHERLHYYSLTHRDLLVPPGSANLDRAHYYS